MIKNDIKHYLYVGGILCAIGVVSALLIGVTNLITSNVILDHEAKKEQKALKEVFLDDEGNIPDDLVFDDKVEISKSDVSYKYPNLISFWNVRSEDEDATSDNKYGYVFKTEGSDKNNYGTIAMLVAINIDFSIGKISIIKNTESYATTVQKDYVDPYNKGDKELNDVTCGATYGATIIKEMAESASLYAKEFLKNGK